MIELAKRYGALFDNVLVPVARSLEQVLTEWLSACPRIDRVSARAKSPERFLAKAAKRSPNGESSYLNPMQDIQDQIGARVTVFFLSDVANVSAVIEQYLKPREIAVKTPESDSEFSYFGKHFILELPADAIPAEIDRAEVPEVFELQIKTLFQHAWSEANHDLGYKPRGKALAPEQRRLLAYSSAQAWGADRVFDQLHCELN